MLHISSYALKTGFQKKLVPLRDRFIRLGIQPNQITWSTCMLCVVYALLLIVPALQNLLLALMPLMLLLRMALNALDGMVAKASQQQTVKGCVLNEVCDVISDAALLGSFLMILPGQQGWLLLLIFLGMLIEFLSLAIYQAIHYRPIAGLYSKSDRAIYLGVLALLCLFMQHDAALLTTYLWLGIALSLMTIWVRASYIRYPPESRRQ